MSWAKIATNAFQLNIDPSVVIEREGRLWSVRFRGETIGRYLEQKTARREGERLLREYGAGCGWLAALHAGGAPQ